MALLNSLVVQLFELLEVRVPWDGGKLDQEWPRAALASLALESRVAKHPSAQPS